MKYFASLAAVAVLIAVLATTTEAHKSVKHKRPPTEEEKLEQHIYHRYYHSRVNRHPVHDETDEEFMARQNLPEATVYHKSRHYHRQFGPEYPEHHETKESHFDEHRFAAKVVESHEHHDGW